MKKQLLILSLTPALFSIAGKLALYYTHNQFNVTAALYSGISWIAVLFVSIFFSIKYVRHHVYGGYLNLRQAMKTGLLVSVISGLVIGVFTFFFLEYVNTEYILHSLNQAKETMESEKKSAEEIQNNLELLKESVLNPFKLAVSGVGYTVVPGAFMSFICATFLLKNPEEN